MHIIQAEIGAPKITAKSIGDNHTLFTVAPLPSGYGMTLGNTFRRVLLSSLPGAAVTAVKIKGATHEYTSLAGVQDSVLDMLLNLKSLHVKMTGKGPAKIKLESKSAGEVQAKDIETGSEVEIVNKDLLITKLDKKGSLSIEITIEKGVGYAPAAERQKNNKETGLIYLDATFCPVERVRYDVTATRVGERTNLDKLELEVLTNGSMSPEDSIKFASDIMSSYYSLFNAADEIIEGDFIADAAKVAAAEAAVTAAAKSPIGGTGEIIDAANDGGLSEKYTPIETLQFSPRTLNALINGGIGSIEQLIKCSPNKIANLRGFGAKALDEVADKLREHGHELGGEE